MKFFRKLRELPWSPPEAHPMDPDATAALAHAEAALDRAHNLATRGEAAKAKLAEYGRHDEVTKLFLRLIAQPNGGS